MQKEEFAKHRSQLFHKMIKNSMAIVPTAPVNIRNNDVEFPFRADSNFYWLTGFEEPEAVAVFTRFNNKNHFILFNRERDPEMETWNGRRAGQLGARKSYGANEAFAISELDKIIPDLMSQCEKVYYALGSNKLFDKRVLNWLNQIKSKTRAGTHAPSEFSRLDCILHELRLIKSKQEIQNMSQAAEISAQAHNRAMSASRPGLYEHQIEAELRHSFLYHGCRRAAYPSIVASGKNACILHYTENDAKLKNGDLLLIDAGGEYNYYAADITRTFPINGRFSREQASIYDLVLDAQLAALEEVKPGNHYNQPHEAAVKVLTKGLVKLGLLQGRTQTLIKEEAYKPFYMHRTGHWLGMDVHDVGEYKLDNEWRTLKPGMTLTIEPGLYITPGTKGVAKKWCNIGVRIEDDVLVTAKGHKILSHSAVKQRHDIEQLMSD